MTTAKHTPGPWKVGNGRSIEATVEGEQVQVALGSRTVWSYPDQGKNDRLRQTEGGDLSLIAAAPEMLEALKRSNKILERKADDDDATEEELAAILANRAAIAKAEGGAQ